MAVKKKSVVNETTTDAKNMISVDAHKLSQGLKMTFEGVAMVFDSLGAESGIPMMSDGAVAPVVAPSAADKKQGKQQEKQQEKQEPSAEINETKAEPVAAEIGGTEAETDTAAPEAAVAVGEGKNAEIPADSTASEQAEPASTVTLDDITKIIVQKIKKNRSNNEKIGSILKTYGVAKVGELPASKYEAFLTDLAAI